MRGLSVTPRDSTGSLLPHRRGEPRPLGGAAVAGGAAGDPPLLAAIADGTFGLMKRPADAGRGLDGVAVKSEAYYNPASDILEEQ